MCKILIITNTRKITDHKALVTNAAAKLKSQRDGFGWAAITEDNKIFGVRTNDVEKFVSRLEGKKLMLPFLEGSDSDNEFGEFAPAITSRAFIAHGRVSTNNKDLINVHPINRAGWSLIHNGVVTDHGPKYEMHTTNDSEHVLKHLVTGGISAVSEHLTGYYAFAAFDPSGNLHIGRDRIADLYCAYVDSLESYVYATTKALITEMYQCSTGWVGLSAIAKMQDDVYVIHKPDGTFTWDRFKSRGRDVFSFSMAQRSLGRSFDDGDESQYYNDWLERTKSDPNISLSEASWARAGYVKSVGGVGYVKKSEVATTSVVEALPVPSNVIALEAPRYTKTERNQIRQGIYKNLTAYEKKSAKKFFRYVDDSRNQFFVFKNDTDKTAISRSDYDRMSPMRQIDFLIVDSVTYQEMAPFSYESPEKYKAKNAPLLGQAVT